MTLALIFAVRHERRRVFFSDKIALKSSGAQPVLASNFRGFTK